MRKVNFYFLLIAGIGVGTSLGVAFNHIPAGFSLGAGLGILAVVLSVLKNKKKKPGL